MRNDDLMNDFFADVESHLEQVEEGIELIRSNQMLEGINTVMRPIHTIKGTTGFISGLEQISKFSHKVEDYLKEIQNNNVHLLPPHITDLLVKAIGKIFDLLELAKNGEKVEDTEAWDILDNIDKALHPSPSAKKDGIVVEDRNNVSFVRISMDRIHLPGQYRLLTDTFKGLKNDKQVILDLFRVRSVGSTAWGAIWKEARKKKVSIIGMNDTCRTIFKIWGFDQFMEVFESEEDFWNGRESLVK